MYVKLFVGNLPWSIRDKELADPVQSAWAGPGIAGYYRT